MATVNIGFDLDKYPTLRRMSESEAMIRIALGPAGTGKTSYCAMELLRLAMLQPPSPVDNTRYFRACVIRQTYHLLTTSTVNTFRQMFGPLYKGTMGSQPKGQVSCRLPDGTDLDMEIIYLAMDNEESQTKLLGLEVTFFFLDEISELPESLVYSCVQRLGRYPSGAKGEVARSGIIAATNGPNKNHWLYKWYMGENDERFAQVAASMGVSKYMELFQQPPALLRPETEGGEWQPNPLAENIHNLAQGYGYYYAMLGNPDNSKVQAYVEGVFADLKAGKVVFPEFSRELHTFPAAQVITRDIRNYYLSFDFGRTPVCIVSYLTADGSIVVLDEFTGEDTSVEALYRNEVQPALKQRYPSARCAGAFGDPAGMQGGQAVDLSPFQVLRDLGVPITAPTRNNKLEPRLQAVRRFMSVLGPNGKPRLRVRDNCKYLIQALASDYIYEAKAGGGVREEPTKTHVGWASDLCFAAGTMVATPHGDRSIETIQAGDEVFTSGGVRTVTAAAMTNPAATVYEYYIGDTCLVATPNHPVFADGEFVPVDSLVGKTVSCKVSRYADSRKELVMDSVSTPVRRGQELCVPVYNLTADGEHDYFANGVLVHNCDSLQYLCMGILRTHDNTPDERKPANINWLG